MMRFVSSAAVSMFAAVLWLAACSPSSAQELASRTSLNDEAVAGTYYPPQAYRPEPRAIIHEKAQARSLQRQARMASMSWYGMSNSRPQASGTPFMSHYSPSWEMPGGKPYSWYPNYQWPGYVTYVR